LQQKKVGERNIRKSMGPVRLGGGSREVQWGTTSGQSTKKKANNNCGLSRKDAKSGKAGKGGLWGQKFCPRRKKGPNR